MGASGKMAQWVRAVVAQAGESRFESSESMAKRNSSAVRGENRMVNELAGQLSLSSERETPSQGSKADSESAGCPVPSFILCANMHAHTCTHTHTVFLDTIGLANLLMLFMSQDLLTFITSAKF